MADVEAYLDEKLAFFREEGVRMPQPAGSSLWTHWVTALAATFALLALVRAVCLH